MANVLSEEKRQQIEALRLFGWSLRSIEREASVRHETASSYVKAAGIELRGEVARRQNRDHRLHGTPAPRSYRAVDWRSVE